jgi:hypothetical protein
MNLRRPPHKQTVPDVPRVKPVLPQALASYVKAGPVDEEGWTLLVANTAISAKLRQLQPRLMEALARQGLKINAIRLRVQAR